MKKIKLISHNDLDGVSPAILGRLAFQESLNYDTVGISRINETVNHFLDEHNNKETDLYITDISVSEEVAERLDKLVKSGQKIMLIDHHVSTLPLAEKYDWIHVTTEDVNGVRTSATSLFYKYLVDEKLLEPTDMIDEYVELVRQYDTWDWFRKKNEKAKKLNHLYYLINHEEFKDTIYEMLKSSYNKESQAFQFSEKHAVLLDAEEKKIEKYIHDKQKQLIIVPVQINGNDYTAGVVFAESNQSELGNALCLENKEIDFSVMIDMGNKKIGLRAVKDEINLADIASYLGGGGHPKAAGCMLTEDIFQLFAANFFQEK